MAPGTYAVGFETGAAATPCRFGSDYLPQYWDDQLTAGSA